MMIEGAGAAAVVVAEGVEAETMAGIDQMEAKEVVGKKGTLVRGTSQVRVKISIEVVWMPPCHPGVEARAARTQPMR